MKIQELVRVLRAIAPSDFTADCVIKRLAGVSVDDASLQPYLFWEPKRYTRNLIYRDANFEILAVAWESGCSSPIHNHAGQDCWLYVHSGNLCIDTFELSDPQHCGREGNEICVKKRERIGCVGQGTIDHRGPEKDLHRVMNRRAFGERAVSLHVYARPIDSCIIYDQGLGSAKRVTMRYDSIGGHRVPRPHAASISSALADAP